MQSLGTSIAKDARTRRSREALRNALLSLVEEKAYEQISVREIAAKANVSFPTFYRQFSSKDELLNDIATGEIAALLAITEPLLNRRSARINADAICQFVLDRKMLWRTLLTTGATATLRDEFITHARTLALSHRLRNPELPLDLMSPLIVGGIFEVLYWWLKQPEDFPTDVVAQLLETFVLWPSSKRVIIDYFVHPSEADGTSG